MGSEQPNVNAPICSTVTSSSSSSSGSGAGYKRGSGNAVSPGSDVVIPISATGDHAISSTVAVANADEPGPGQNALPGLAPSPAPSPVPSSPLDDSDAEIARWLRTELGGTGRKSRNRICCLTDGASRSDDSSDEGDASIDGPAVGAASSITQIVADDTLSDAPKPSDSAVANAPSVEMEPTRNDDRPQNPLAPASDDDDNEPFDEVLLESPVPVCDTVEAIRNDVGSHAREVVELAGSGTTVDKTSCFEPMKADFSADGEDLDDEESDGEIANWLQLLA